MEERSIYEFTVLVVCKRCGSPTWNLRDRILYCPTCHIYYLVISTSVTTAPLGYGDGQQIVEGRIYEAQEADLGE